MMKDNIRVIRSLVVSGAEGNFRMTQAGAAIILFLAAALLLAPFLVRGDEMKIEWDDYIEVARDEAYRGPWRMNQSDWSFVDDPAVALTDQGQAGVAWVDQAQQDIFFQIFAPGGQPRFSEPVNVSRSPEIFSWLPRVIMTTEEPEKVFILWQEIVFSGGSHGGEIFFSRSEDGGRTFSTPLNLSNTIAGAGKGRLIEEIWFNGSLDLARSTDDGTLYAAWTEFEGALYFSRSIDQGKSFSPPMIIAGEEGTLPARGPRLAAGPEGEIHLVWTVGEDPAADVHYARSTDQGRTFTSPRNIVPSDNHSDAPRVALDSAGSIHLVYTEGLSGPLQEFQVRYSRSEGDELFSEPRRIPDGDVEISAGQGFPDLGLDGRDTVYILWELFPEEEFSRPLGLGISFSSDRGKTFSPAVRVPGTHDPDLGFNGGLQGLFMNKLAVNSEGELAVVNSTFQEGGYSRIRLIRGRVGQADH